MPPVVVGGAEHEGEDAEGGDSAEDGGEVGAEAHALEELCHAGAFLGADGEDAEHGKDHAHGCDEHRGDDGLGLHLGACHIECGRAECHGAEDGAAVALIEVCAHAGHVTHVVTDVVGDGGGVAGIVLREVALDLSDDVGAYVSGLGVDTAAHAGEEGLGGCTHSEGKHGGGDDHELLRGVGLLHESVQDDPPDGDVEQAEAHYGEAHHGAGAERYLEAGIKAPARCIGSTAGSEGGGLHPDEACEAGEETAGEECERNPGVLDAESVREDREEYGEHDEDYDHYLVLLLEVSHGSLTHVLRDLLHSRGTLVLLLHLTVEDECEEEREDRRNGNGIK